MKHYFSGLKFGMLLQIAVGPVCLTTFVTAQNSGFASAMVFVAAVALIDALFILLAAVGISRMLRNERLQHTIRLIGVLVLMLFGVSMTAGALGWSILPSLQLNTSDSGFFVKGLLLTVSNPLTIVFWGSVLTAKLVDEHFTRSQLAVYSAGLVSSTVLFLTAVAALGCVLSRFLPTMVSQILNALVGVVIICFGVKMLFCKVH